MSSLTQRIKALDPEAEIMIRMSARSAVSLMITSQIMASSPYTGLRHKAFLVKLSNALQDGIERINGFKSVLVDLTDNPQGP